MNAYTNPRFLALAGGALLLLLVSFLTGERPRSPETSPQPSASATATATSEASPTPSATASTTPTDANATPDGSATPTLPPTPRPSPGTLAGLTATLPETIVDVPRTLVRTLDCTAYAPGTIPPDCSLGETFPSELAAGGSDTADPIVVVATYPGIGDVTVTRIRDAVPAALVAWIDRIRVDAPDARPTIRMSDGHEIREYRFHGALSIAYFSGDTVYIADQSADPEALLRAIFPLIESR